MMIKIDFRHIVQVNTFPETANGKLDRKALRDPLDSDLCEDAHGVEENAAEDDNDDEESDYDKAEVEEAKKEVTSNKVSKRLKCDMQGIVFDEQKAAKMAMAKHVVDMVEKVSPSIKLALLLFFYQFLFKALLSIPLFYTGHVKSIYVSCLAPHFSTFVPPSQPT